MATALYIGADHTVTYSGMTAGGSYQNSATVTYALKDAVLSTVSGGTGTLSYVAASSGNYSGSIESTVTSTLTAGQVYFLDITASQGSYNDFRRLELYAEYRGGS